MLFPMQTPVFGWLSLKQTNLRFASNCNRCLGGMKAELEISFPAAFTKAMTQSWTARNKPFRYVHCSGILAEKDQTKTLWFMQEDRRAKAGLHLNTTPASLTNTRVELRLSFWTLLKASHSEIYGKLT